FCVTPNHDIVHFDEYHGSQPRKLAARSFNGHARRHIPVAGIKTSGRSQMTALERVRVAFAANGTMPDSRHTGSRHGYLRVTISLKKQRKLNRLRDLLQSASIDFDTTVLDSGQTIFRLNAPVDITKKLSDWVHISEVSSDWCDDFIEEITHWDGNDK